MYERTFFAALLIIAFSVFIFVSELFRNDCARKWKHQSPTAIYIILCTYNWYHNRTKTTELRIFYECVYHANFVLFFFLLLIYNILSYSSVRVFYSRIHGIGFEPFFEITSKNSNNYVTTIYYIIISRSSRLGPFYDINLCEYEISVLITINALNLETSCGI